MDGGVERRLAQGFQKDGRDDGKGGKGGFMKQEINVKCGQLRGDEGRMARGKIN